MAVHPNIDQSRDKGMHIWRRLTPSAKNQASDTAKAAQTRLNGPNLAQRCVAEPTV